jgi:cell division transport system permease protein
MNNERYFKARTRSSNVSTMIGIALVLFMLGVLGFLVLNAQALERYFRENVRVEVFLKRDLKEVDLMQFRKELDNEPFTKETRYVTADEAAELLKKDLGEDFLGVLGSNPLLPSVELNLERPTYAVPDSLKWIVAHLKKDRRVQEVAYNAAVVENIDTNMGKLTLMVLGFTALLLIIAIALINNTIRLAIYSKRFLIRTMHLVGATQWFIKKPFLGQSLWQGILGRCWPSAYWWASCNWHSTTCRTCWPSPMPHLGHPVRRCARARPGDLPGIHLVRRGALPSHELRGPALELMASSGTPDQAEPA